MYMERLHRGFSHVRTMQGKDLHATKERDHLIQGDNHKEKEEDRIHPNMYIYIYISMAKR